MKDLRTLITEGPLLFDGATGSLLIEQTDDPHTPPELINLTNPGLVTGIHRAYVEAGAQAIKTNTFAADAAGLGLSHEQILELVEAAYLLAKEAAGGSAHVFADMGPLPVNAEQAFPIADRFLSLGARHFLFETLPGPEGLMPLADHIKKAQPEAFLLASFAATPDGFTHQGGYPIAALLDEVSSWDGVDAVGINCVSGPLHLLALARKLPKLKKPLSIMPNASYPTLQMGRMAYAASPGYFARYMADIAEYAQILGGCCGTTPEHIRTTRRLLDERAPGKISLPAEPKSGAPSAPAPPENALKDKLRAKERIIVVEIDPPADMRSRKFFEGAKLLQAAGADALTIADCPIARVRADSSLLASKLKRELGVEVIPHMTCRDRNLNASKALLLGLGIEGVANVLVVTGDPIPSALGSEVKGVFNFNSVTLARYIRELKDSLGLSMNVLAALNVNAPNFEVELKKAQRKEDVGVTAFLTQPVFDDRAIENLHRARDVLSGALLGGIAPLVSHRNALFMQNEVAGMRIPDAFIARYEGLDREASEELALELSLALAARMREATHGTYLITPFGRVSLMIRLMDALRGDETP